MLAAAIIAAGAAQGRLLDAGERTEANARRSHAIACERPRASSGQTRALLNAEIETGMYKKPLADICQRDTLRAAVAGDSDGDRRGVPARRIAAEGDR